MSAYQQQKQQILRLFEEARAIAKSQQDSNLADHLEKSQQHLAEEKLYVVVCGEFKQGKSSLINAFLDETNLFPVDVKITTNLVSTISYAQQEKISVVAGEIGKGEIKQIERSEIPEYVTEQRNKGNEKKAKVVMIESPNPHLKEGLVLVDTPGIGSLNNEHTALTYSFIPSADVILFVTDILAPLKVEELNFIKDRLLPHCQNIIFVITKIDAITNYQTIIDSNREKLSKLLNCSAYEICLIPVSSRAKQDYLIYKDPEDLEYSHIPELQAKVWSLVKEQRGQSLLLKALTELGRSLTQIKRPLEVEWQSYQQRSENQLDAGEQDIKKIQKQLQDLLQNNAEWQTCLRDGLEDIKSKIQDQFQTGFIKLQRQSVKYLEDHRLLNNPEQIASLLEVDIDGMMTDLIKKLNSQAATLYAEIEDKSGLNFNPFSVTSLKREQADFALEDLQIKQSTVVDKAVNVGRTGAFNAGAGSCLGGLIGAIVGMAGFVVTGGAAIALVGTAINVGMALGAMAGTTKGVIEGIQDLPKQDQVLAKQEISKILKQYIEDSQRHCLKTLNQSVKSLERFMRDELTSQIRRNKESYDKSLQSLQQARKRSHSQSSQRVTQLQTPLEKISKMQREVEKLAMAVISSPFPPQVSPPQPVAMKADADYGDWANE